MISGIIAGLGAAIGKQVLAHLEDRRDRVQFELMQGEVLEGWLYKIRVAVRDELRRSDVPHYVYERVMERMDEVIEKEIDTRKI